MARWAASWQLPTLLNDPASDVKCHRCGLPLGLVCGLICWSLQLASAVAAPRIADAGNVGFPLLWGSRFEGITIGSRADRQPPLTFQQLLRGAVTPGVPNGKRISPSKALVRAQRQVPLSS